MDAFLAHRPTGIDARGLLVTDGAVRERLEAQGLEVAAATRLLLADARSWRDATRLIDASPAAGDGAWAPRPAGPAPAGYLTRARLLVGPDTVVVRDTGGREAWLHGPARGGVTRTATTGDALVLVDARAVP